MHQSLHDYFWVWVVGIVVVVGVLFYISLKMTGFLEKIINRRLRGAQTSVKQKGGSGMTSEKDKNRYKSF